MNLHFSKKLRYAGKKLAIIALALLMLVSILPAALPSARAALEENLSAVSAGDAVKTDDKAVSSGDAEDEGNVLVSAGDASGSDVMLLAATIAEGECGNCTWVIDDAGVLTISPKPGTDGVLESGDALNSWGWHDYRADVTSVVVESGVVCGSNVNFMFSDMTNCTSMNLANLNTSNVTSAAYMFTDSKALTALDLSGWNTSNVTDMTAMFRGCGALASLDVSGWNTSNVTDMSAMFSSCSALTSLDLSDFDTSNVTEMDTMFYGCSSLTLLDVTSFNTSNVTTMQTMFRDCKSLNTLDVSGFDTSKTTNLSSMFSGCSSLISLDVDEFDTANVTDMSDMFFGCRSLTTLDVSGFDTSNVTTIASMFYNCSKLTEIDVSEWKTGNIKQMSTVFQGCGSVTELDVSEWDTSSATNMMSMFNSCSKLTSLDVSNFDTSNVTNISWMFSNCGALTSIDVTSFDTSSVTDMSYLFNNCGKLTSLDISSFDTSAVQNMQSTFSGCKGLNEIIVGTDWIPATNYAQRDGVNFFNVVDGNLIVKPKDGYTVKSITVGGEEVEPEFDEETGTYTYAGFTGDSVAVIEYAPAKTVTFMDNGTEVEKQLVAIGNDAKDPYKDNVPVVPGMRYLGWDKAFTNVQSDLTVNALWEPDEYTLTFDVNGGDALAADKQTKTVTYTLPVGELPAATRTGYTFDGWFDGNGTKYTADTVYNVQADTTLTAQWTINEYDVNYHITDISEHPTKGVLPGTDTLEHGTAYTAKFPAAIDGFTFFGWYTDEGYTAEYVDGTPITADTDLYGHWTRDGALLGGMLTWVENGEGFVRPDSVTVNLYQNGTLIDTCVVPKDETADVQYYSFDEVFVTDMDSNPYVYTVDIDTVPENYVSVVSGLDITNTYNVNTYTITKQWDNTGNPDGLPESVKVELYCDSALYRTVTLTEANGWSQTVTVPRLIAQDSTFTVKEITVPGFSSVYEAPVPKDTDGDGTADAITYVIKNAYIMPQITVSGDIAWDKVPDGMTEPDMTVNLLLGGSVIDTVTVPAGVTAYSFGELDRYDDEGSALAYTVEVEEIADYDVVTAAPATDADGNIDIDITATGTFTYGALTISSTVTGEDAPADAEFVYTVTFDSTVSYPYTGSAAGTIKSGDKITLKAGESVTIANILVGVKYTVTQDEAENFVTTPASGKAEGAIAATPAVAAFSNAYNPPVATGTLTITNKVTGTSVDTTLKFPFKVEFDAEGSYELRIYGAGETVPAAGSTGMLGRITLSAAGSRATTSTIKSGDTIQLAHGETAVIYGLPAGTTYKVTETDQKGYKLTSTGASGTVSQDGAKASFINEKNKASTGGTNVPDTGDYGTNSTADIVVMQVALLAALLLVFCARKLRENSEAEAR